MLSKLYAIADLETLARHNISLHDFAQALSEANITLVQLRAKQSSPAEILAHAAILRGYLPQATLIMNDRADLAALAAFDGVHVGQDDLTVADARLLLPGGIVGVSTHTLQQVATTADYTAIGPIFPTNSKSDAAAAVGLEGLRLARALTGKPIVAIGGITRENCLSVLAAGADSVAVISGLLPVPGQSFQESFAAWVKLTAHSSRLFQTAVTGPPLST